MEAQEMFDTVVKHLAAQGKKSLDLNKIEWSGAPSCMYRAPDGCKCAAGVLIPDDKYDPSYEGKKAGALPFFQELHLSSHAIDLLKEAQNIHDNYAIQNWSHMFHNLADDLSLDKTVLEGLVWNNFTVETVRLLPPGS